MKKQIKNTQLSSQQIDNLKNNSWFYTAGGKGLVSDFKKLYDGINICVGNLGLVDKKFENLKWKLGNRFSLSEFRKLIGVTEKETDYETLHELVEIFFQATIHVYYNINGPVNTKLIDKITEEFLELI